MVTCRRLVVAAGVLQEVAVNVVVAKADLANRPNSKARQSVPLTGIHYLPVKVAFNPCVRRSPTFAVVIMKIGQLASAVAIQHASIVCQNEQECPSQLINPRRGGPARQAKAACSEQKGRRLSREPGPLPAKRSAANLPLALSCHDLI
jgi:hypothetical protein